MRWTGQVKNLGNELHRPGCEANVDHAADGHPTVLRSLAKKSRNSEPNRHGSSLQGPEGS
ncbi:hypothetical protein E4U56_008486 [Claviceps arundinis]|uniref:Uncharacterized protein n=1 Tax=Claviceps arundinis TaxID=1623583 RepID=A0A9P7MUJ4_9HYPO|nr:hypothetical protein E4U56_008486 [Claviceps arundinis]